MKAHGGHWEGKEKERSQGPLVWCQNIIPVIPPSSNNCKHGIHWGSDVEVLIHFQMLAILGGLWPRSGETPNMLTP